MSEVTQAGSAGVSTGEQTRQEQAVQGPIRLILRFDTAHIHREGGGVLVLGGLLARSGHSVKIEG